MAGIFNLREPIDLLSKLKRELDRLRSSPSDVDHAFNFFTTAEHMLDWLYPGDVNKTRRNELRNDNPLLATVSHLATGAKHFDKLSLHHKSVKSSNRSGGFWASRLWASNFWARNVWAQPRLTIELSGAAAQSLGTKITALALAEKVYEYWSAPGRVSGLGQK